MNDVVRQIIHDCSRDATTFQRLTDLFSHYQVKTSHYDLIHKNLQEVIFEIDEDGLWQFLSPAWETLTGFTVAECLGKPFVDYIYIEDRPADWRKFMPGVDNQPSCFYETRYRKKSGGYCHVEVHARLAFNRDQQEIGVVGILRDITERKHAEQRELNLTLEQARSHLLTTFIQNAAHEFRTPLATINTSTYLITRSSDADRIRRKTDEIERQVKRITRLIDMLLLMVRLENTQPQCMEVSLAALLRNVAMNLRTRYGDHPVLRLLGLSDLPPVSANADDLSDAFTQVIENAYHYTPADGTIAVEGRVDDETLVVTIQDTGTGITAEDMTHIFETFWRADHSHTTPGFGLGLPIAHRIITQHGGTIAVESVPEHGTTVTITLPRIAA